MKIAPKPLWGVLVVVAYMVVFCAVWAVTGVDYSRVGESVTTIASWYVAPLAAGAVVLVIAASVLGWWRPALFEVERAKPSWLWLSVVVMVGIAIVFLVNRDFSVMTPLRFVLVAIGSLLVGFNEELATRGLLIVGLRGRFTEPMVWFWASAIFGLIHLPNAFFGAGAAAVMQIILAFLSGSMLYVIRRVSGSLFLPMLVHGFWDFSQFIAPAASNSANMLVFLNAGLGLVLALILVLRERGKRIPLAGAPARVAEADEPGALQPNG
jgi:membrane protease YdiL (CAAX protease family)